jgi:cytidylate kinase
MAQKLGWSLLDSGAIYRAFALAVEIAVPINKINKSADSSAKSDLDFPLVTQADESRFLPINACHNTSLS